MLSSVDLKLAMKNGEIGITPFNESNLGPCSVDLTLGKDIRLLSDTEDTLDLCNFTGEYSEACEIDPVEGLFLYPGECMLAITREKITLSPEHSAQIHSKSSLGRLFQTAHGAGAGFIDPGFSGYVTLEIINFMNRPVRYHVNQMICQVAFHKLDTPTDMCYTSHGGQYQNAPSVPQESKPIKKGQECMKKSSMKMTCTCTPCPCNRSLSGFQ